MKVELDHSTKYSGAVRGPSKTRRLRVLHVGKFYPPHMGGIETHLQALCGTLTERVDLSVVVSSDDRRTMDELVDGVRVTRVGTLLNAFSTSISPGIVSRIRCADADLVHLHLPNPTAVLAYLASGHRGSLVITYHSDTVRQKLLGALFQPFLNSILRRSAAIITTSPNYLESSPVLRAFRDRCHVIPYGIDTTLYEHRDPEAVQQIRRQYGERLVISVGRLVYYKGFDRLLRAMVDVRGKLLIVGDGPLRGELQSLATQLGISNKVAFAGEIQNARMAPYYHASDLFALASVARSEAFGIVQIEAMAAGLPVVNTSLDSGVPYVSLHQETGLTVPPGDPTALAGAINRLLDDPALRETFGRAGARRAQEQFSLDSMQRRTLQLYHSLVKR
ncbi:MAG TPA: glycosyltransferase [Bryobacteraceae bacterium]|nr:glycosyltransferase [Bryobacteraceae bacterium]